MENIKAIQKREAGIKTAKPMPMLGKVIGISKPLRLRSMFFAVLYSLLIDSILDTQFVKRVNSIARVSTFDSIPGAEYVIEFKS